MTAINSSDSSFTTDVCATLSFAAVCKHQPYYQGPSFWYRCKVKLTFFLQSLNFCKRSASASGAVLLPPVGDATVFPTDLPTFLVITFAVLDGGGIGGSSSCSLSECQSSSFHGSVRFDIVSELVRVGLPRALAAVLLDEAVLGKGRMHCRWPFRTSRYLFPS